METLKKMVFSFFWALSLFGKDQGLKKQTACRCILGLVVLIGSAPMVSYANCGVAHIKSIEGRSYLYCGDENSNYNAQYSYPSGSLNTLHHTNFCTVVGSCSTSSPTLISGSTYLFRSDSSSYFQGKWTSAGWTEGAAFSTNSAPTVTGIASNITVIEDAATDVNLSAATFVDTDGDSLTVTLTANSGALAATTGGSVNVGGSGTGTMTLAGTAANINTYLDTTTNIKYTTASNDNTTRNIAIKAYDGTIDSATSNVTVNITDIADIIADTVPSNATYKVGDNLDFTLVFDEAVTVTNAPRLTLTIGSVTKYADFISGSTSTTLIFRYIVEAGLNDADGISVTNAIDLNSTGTIVDTDGNGSGADLSNISFAATTMVLVDNTAPDAPSVPDLVASSDAGISNTDNWTYDNTPTFTGTAEADSTVRLYRGTSLIGTGTATEGTWSIDAVEISNGDHTITATATDAVGNISIASSGLSIIINNTPPSELDVTVKPIAGSSVGLSAEGNFILSINAFNFGANLYSLEVDHTFTAAGIPEFTVYANNADPYGGIEARTLFENVGATITYDETNKLWTIDFGATLTNVLLGLQDADGKAFDIEFYLVVRDEVGNPWGDMLLPEGDVARDGTPANYSTFSYNIGRVPVTISSTLTMSEDHYNTLVFSYSDANEYTITATQKTAASHGIINITGTDIRYTPVANFNGSDTFTVTLTDSKGFSVDKTISVNVSSVNDEPVITITDTLAVDEDGNQTLSFSYTDIDGDTVSASVNTQAAHGSVTVINGTFSYVPNDDYAGDDSFTLILTDSEGYSVIKTVNVTVAPINDKPIAVDDNLTESYNSKGSYVLDVLNNDSDLDGDTLTIINASVDIGSVSVESGQLLYQAGVAPGNATFSYVISDGIETAKASVTLTIDDIPLEGLPIITLPADVEVNATGLYTKVDLGVAKAVDSAGNPLPVSLLDGITVFVPGNNIAYWQAVDANGSASVAMQKVVVHPLITLSKNEQSVEGTSHSVGVHLNGTSPLYPVTIAYTVGGTTDASDHNLTSGEVSIEQGTSTTINFDVLVDAIAEENETLTISLSNGAIYTLEVSEKNLAPTISYHVTQGGEQRSLIEIGGGDIVIQTQVYDGNPTDTHTYHWASSLVDTDNDETSFTIDSANLSAGIQTIDVSVTDSADTPATTTANIYLKVQETLPVLTSEDTDGDLIPDSEEGLGDADADGIPDYLDVASACNVMPEQVSNSNIFLVEGEAGVCLRKGSTVANNRTGGLELIPDEVAQDTQATNTGGLFDFIAYGLPKVGQTYSLVLPQRLPIPASAIYRKYTPSKGWFEFVVDENNGYSSTLGDKGYCPAPEDNGWTAGLTEGHWCVKITLEDGGPNDDDGEANGSIVDPGGVGVWLSSNSLPDAQNESAETAWNTAITIDVLANDTDVDNDTLTINSASADFGDVTIVDEQLIYTPATDFFGVATINYGISDNNGGTGFAQVTVNVIENEAPIANDDLADTDDRTAITVNVLENDSDGNDDELTIISATAEYGNAIITEGNKIDYTPKIGFDGVDTITYTIDDGKGSQAQATVSITVTAYEVITVTNKSSGGGSMGYLALLLGSLLIIRRTKKIVQTNQVRQWSITVLALSLLSFNSQASWYLDATVGQAKVKDTNTSLQLSTVSEVEDSDTSWSLGGGYAFDNGIDVGVYYLDMGEGSATISGESLSPEQYHQSASTLSPILVSGVGVEIGYRFWQEQNFGGSVFVGMLAWEGDISSEYNGQILNTEDDGTDVYYGIKGTYQLSSQWQLGLGFKRYNLDPNDVDNVYLSLGYQF